MISLPDNSGRTVLHWAASSRQIDIVRDVLENGKVDIDHKDEIGWTALHCACSAGSDSVIALLLERGANVNAKTDNGQVPLHYVASKNHTRKYLYSADRSSRVLTTNTNLDILPLLIENGAQLNRQDKYGHSPLHRAASRGYEKIVEGLLRAGALADPRDNEGNTPLHMACEEDRLNTGQFIKFLSVYVVILNL